MSGEKAGHFGLTPSRVTKTFRDKDSYGLPVVRRIRKLPDGSTFPTTERISTRGILVRNSKGDSQHFDEARLRKDIESCYGDLHMYDEDVDAICNRVVTEMVSSYEKVGRKKVVDTKIVERAVLTAMEEMSIHSAISVRYIARYCLSSLPKGEVEELIKSIPELKQQIPEI